MEEELRQAAIQKLQHGGDLPVEWARFLSPPEKREYELVYHGKDREEDILANTLTVPLRAVRSLGRNGADWHNMLILGDNLQAMKTLVKMREIGTLCNTDGTCGARLIFVDPPFSTRQKFKGTEDPKAYQDKPAGAEFLEFLLNASS